MIYQLPQVIKRLWICLRPSNFIGGIRCYFDMRKCQKFDDSFLTRMDSLYIAWGIFWLIQDDYDFPREVKA